MKRLLLAAIILYLVVSASQSLSVKDHNDLVSRRDLVWKVPLGAVATYGYGRLAYNALQVQGIRYPSAHEERVASTISTALLAAAASSSLLSSQKIGRTFRILEVGLGQDCRMIRRGLYDSGVKQMVQQQQKQQQ